MNHFAWHLDFSAITDVRGNGCFVGVIYPIQVVAFLKIICSTINIRPCDRTEAERASDDQKRQDGCRHQHIAPLETAGLFVPWPLAPFTERAGGGCHTVPPPLLFDLRTSPMFIFSAHPAVSRGFIHNYWCDNTDNRTTHPAILFNVHRDLVQSS